MSKLLTRLIWIHLKEAIEEDGVQVQIFSLGFFSL
jgi:hypothetical protein